MHSKQVDGQSGLLNPLSLAARPVSQWNKSDMDTMLNSSLFRAFPRMSFRPPVKRKLFDDFSVSSLFLPEIDDLEGFAQHFKKQRIKLGYTQGDVGLALGRKYGTDFSQTTISRFEAMNLSFKNMCKLRPLLKEWLEGQEAAVANGANVEELRSIEISKDCVDELPIHKPTSIEPLMKRRRKRTNLDLSQRKSLDNFFLANPRPGHEEMVRIANALDLERDVCEAQDYTLTRSLVKYCIVDKPVFPSLLARNFATR
uniref:POU-specific domain-containing protein n=1 Tax=Angiostrongylus cantonensis TaxID=6313 RepID=A0A0K0DN77_ANGCA